MATLEVDQSVQSGRVRVDRYESDGVDIDVSDDNLLTIELTGGGGGRPPAKTEDGNQIFYRPDPDQAPGLGGGVEVEVDVSSIDTLTAVVGQGYPCRELSGVDTGDFEGEEVGADGYFAGGDGGEYDVDNADVLSKAGGGGGSTALLDDNGNVLVHADGGGGGTSAYADGDGETIPAGAGGGARGGIGGDSNTGDEGTVGEDGGGSGNGGDGGGQDDYDANPGFTFYGGEDGGYEIVDTGVVTEVSSAPVSTEIGYVEISRDTGSNIDQSLQVLNYSKNEKIFEQSHATVEVLRSEWQRVLPDLNKIFANFTVRVNGSNDFGGRLVNYTNKNSVVVLEIGTYEEDALNSEPTGDIEEYAGIADSTIVNDAVDQAQNISDGNIETLSSNLSFIFSNASYAKVIREVQRTTRAFVRYNPDGSVDYVENIGSDRSESITISPQEQNVTGSFDVIENEREEVTHIRVLGAQEGSARIIADAVSVNYLSGTPQSWKKYKDKEITDEERAQEVANQMISEYEESQRKVEVQTTIFGIDVTIGDLFRVRSEQDNINEVLQVVEITSILEGADFIYEVVLSNRKLTREDNSEKDRRDVQKFNESFQGHLVNPTVGVRNAVGANGSFEFKFRKPDDVVKELSETILVETSEYRAYNSDGVDVTTDFATDIDVYINGTLVIEGATVTYTDFAFDITGEFDEGFNDIELVNNESEAADVQVNVFADYYRQIK